MEILLKLRTSALACSRASWRTALRRTADNLQHAIGDFCTEPSEDNLRKLNGLWAHATRMLMKVPPEGDPVPPAAARGAGSIFF